MGTGREGASAFTTGQNQAEGGCSKTRSHNRKTNTHTTAHATAIGEHTRPGPPNATANCKNEHAAIAALQPAQTNIAIRS
jgi:hypothetical protein